MKVDRNTLNQNPQSLDPIWVDRKIDNACGKTILDIDDVLRFIHDAKIKAEREGFVNVVVWAFSFLDIRGLRKETEEEWRTRLMNMKADYEVCLDQITDEKIKAKQDEYQSAITLISESLLEGVKTE